MKMFLISDNVDTLTGMQLAGIQGVVIHSESELRNELDKVFQDNEIHIVLITEKLYLLNPKHIDKLKLEMKYPLFTIIPDRHGSSRQEDFITKHVKESIGVNFWGEINEQYRWKIRTF